MLAQYAIVFGLISAVVAFFSQFFIHNQFRGRIVWSLIGLPLTVGVVNTLLNFALVWLFLPSFSHWAAGGFGLLLFTDLIIVFVVCLAHGLMVEESGSSVASGTALFLVFTFYLIGAFAVETPGICDVSGTQRMVNLLNIQDSSTNLPETDLANIKRVSAENALLKASRAIGSTENFGSYLAVNRAYLQENEITGDLYYIVDLKVTSWRGFETQGGIIPGYIYVNAKDPEADAEFRKGYSIRISPTMDQLRMFSDQDLDRLVYFDFLINNDFQVMDLDGMEIDNEGKPYYTGTLLEHTVGWQGMSVFGMIVVDAQTGDYQVYKLGEIPDWIDRVYPLSYFESTLNNWWGRYVDHAVCNWLDSSGVRMVDRANDVVTSSGTQFQITMTSENNADQSITEIIYANALTGEAVRVRIGGATAEAVDNLVDEATLADTAEGYEPVDCELHTILSKLVWYCILNGRGAGNEESSGSHYGYAFVQHDNTEEGTKVIKSTSLEDAYRQLARQIATEGGDAAGISENQVEVQFNGILQIKAPVGSNPDNTDNSSEFVLLSILLDGGQTVYCIAHANSLNVSFAQPGNRVYVTGVQEPNKILITVSALTIEGVPDFDSVP